jgi:hypothetical protein
MALLRIGLFTTVFLLLLDLTAGAVLTLAQAQGRLGSLVRYFDYGRSVPGKLAAWEASPETPGNLYEVAWPAPQLVPTEAEGPVVHAYGMSFVNRILGAAQTMSPELSVDLHAGPGAPPNFTYSLFKADRAHRRAGDVVVLGILSSSLTGMASFSNRAWVFEQPAPFTYPIYLPAGPAPGLQKIDPLVQSAEVQRTLGAEPELRADWDAQLRAEDGNWHPATYALPALDASPLARLVRRALASSALETRKAQVLNGGFPIEEVLQRMVVDFARTARADGQTPVVFLIQSRDPRDPNLQEMLRPVLKAHDIAVLDSTTVVSPDNPTHFLPDGHYQPEADKRLAQHLLEMPDLQAAQGGWQVGTAQLVTD